jgi:xylulose-5-phosphate/fructose-6-phosphate phosphoketolase
VTQAGNVPALGTFLGDVMRQNMRNFRVFGPDETQSNPLQALYEVGKKVWFAMGEVHHVRLRMLYLLIPESFPEDADGGELASNGRVMEMLSEHTVEGWLEGYLLSGRHGLSCLRGPVIHHSDQGCPYTSIALGQRCRAGVQPSMGSVVGDAYDNRGQL